MNNVFKRGQKIRIVRIVTVVYETEVSDNYLKEDEDHITLEDLIDEELGNVDIADVMDENVDGDEISHVVVIK